MGEEHADYSLVVGRTVDRCDRAYGDARNLVRRTSGAAYAAPEVLHFVFSIFDSGRRSPAIEFERLRGSYPAAVVCFASARVTVPVAIVPALPSCPPQQKKALGSRLPTRWRAGRVWR